MFSFLLVVLCVLIALQLSSSFQLSGISRGFARKVAAGLVTSGIAFGGAVAMENVALGHPSLVAVAAQTKSVFNGNYDDPNHPGCLRKISVDGKKVTIVGSDNVDGSNQWILYAKEDYPGTIFVDFSPKGGPSDLLGVYNDQMDGIKWPDGNMWAKLKK